MNITRLLRWATIITVLVCAWLLVMTYWGYGHVVISVPSGATVRINGHAVSAGSGPVKLRPGTYKVSVTSARYYSSYESVHVSAFRTTTYKPPLAKRSAASIAYATTGVSALNGVPPVQGVTWFGDTWIVEKVGFSIPSVLAAHYENGRWNKAYFTGETKDTSGLPTQVAVKVNQFQEAINASLE